MGKSQQIINGYIFNIIRICLERGQGRAFMDAWEEGITSYPLVEILGDQWTPMKRCIDWGIHHYPLVLVMASLTLYKALRVTAQERRLRDFITDSERRD